MANPIRIETKVGDTIEIFPFDLGFKIIVHAKKENTTGKIVFDIGQMARLLTLADKQFEEVALMAAKVKYQKDNPETPNPLSTIDIGLLGSDVFGIKKSRCSRRERQPDSLGNQGGSLV